MSQDRHTFYEFFAGGGMVRAGLGDGWDCLFANDFDHKKVSTYAKNWGDSELHHGDVRKVTTSDLPEFAEFIWASFPCQDLSLAGGGAGLRGERSGTFWPFWDLIRDLIKDSRKPPMVVLENVCGTLTSHGGSDFAAICGALDEAGYRFGAAVIDAAYFVPQSRPRLFIIGVSDKVKLPDGLISDAPIKEWHTRTLIGAYNKLNEIIQRNWLWWNIPAPVDRKSKFAHLIEENPDSTRWRSPEETQQLLNMMSDVNLEKVRVAQKLKKKAVGAMYKRTRCDENGRKVQRAEIRFDDIAGCLRTPAGGSSRQLIVVVEGDTIRSRLISTRETARLMGLADNYELPQNYNEAYHLTGDGVVVPVVRHLADSIFEPVLRHNRKAERNAA